MISGRDAVQRLIAGKNLDRVALMDAPWGDTLVQWMRQGYPTRRVFRKKGETYFDMADGKGRDVLRDGEFEEPVPPWLHFGYDMVGVGGWFDVMPNRGFEALVEETAEWEVKLNGVNTSHYLPYEQAAAACAGTPMFHKGDVTNADRAIYLPTEFMHGLYDGGAGAGLEDIWELMRQSKFIGGGFIWALLDEGIRRPETGEIDVAGNRAPDGLVGPHREREGSFYTVKELWSPIVVAWPRPTHGPRAAVTLLVQNRYSFVNASQCRFLWELRKFRLPNDPEAGFSLSASGEVRAPSIPPGGEGEIKPDLPGNWAGADALALVVQDPGGRELWTWVWPLPGLKPATQLTTPPSVQEATFTDFADALALKAGGLTVRISKATGLLASVQRGGQTFSLTNGPRPVVGEAKLTSQATSVDGSDYVVTERFSGNLESVIWRLRGNGWLQCAYTYDATGPQDSYGVVFDYPEPLVKKKKWLGDGPYRVWKNRRRGVTLNVWENDYNNTITGWKDWVYPEFKGCFGNVHWLQLETSEGPITAVPERADGFVQVLTPEFPPAELVAKTLVTLPRAGLAFLQAIPPVGSKFHPASESGPQSQPNLATGQYSGSVDFFFGRQ